MMRACVRACVRPCVLFLCCMYAMYFRGTCWIVCIKVFYLTCHTRPLTALWLISALPGCLVIWLVIGRLLDGLLGFLLGSLSGWLLAWLFGWLLVVCRCWCVAVVVR